MERERGLDSLRTPVPDALQALLPRQTPYTEPKFSSQGPEINGWVVVTVDRGKLIGIEYTPSVTPQRVLEMARLESPEELSRLIALGVEGFWNEGSREAQRAHRNAGPLRIRPDVDPLTIIQKGKERVIAQRREALRSEGKYVDRFHRYCGAEERILYLLLALGEENASLEEARRATGLSEEQVLEGIRPLRRLGLRGNKRHGYSVPSNPEKRLFLSRRLVDLEYERLKPR